METDRREGGLGSVEPEVEAAPVAATTDSGPADVVVSRNKVRAEDGALLAADAAPAFVAMTSASSELAAEAIVPVTVDADGGAGLALLEVATARPEPAQAEPPATEPMLPGQALAQLRVTRAASAPRPARSGRAASRAVAADSVTPGDLSGARPDQPSVPEDAPRAVASSASTRPASQASYTEDFARAVIAAESASAETGPTPHELNPAQSAPLVATIAALHNVIADQRRALTDLSRRMKWTLGAVAGALLVTVAAGVAQTVVLARLTTDASAQQQRITQMMQDQQTALAAMQAHLPPQAEAQPASPGITRPAAPSQHAKHTHRAHTAAQ